MYLALKILLDTRAGARNARANRRSQTVAGSCPHSRFALGDHHQPPQPRNAKPSWLTPHPSPSPTRRHSVPHPNNSRHRYQQPRLPTSLNAPDPTHHRPLSPCHPDSSPQHPETNSQTATTEAIHSTHLVLDDLPPDAPVTPCAAVYGPARMGVEGPLGSLVVGAAVRGVWGC
jgi:hypothetical protein